MQFISFYFFFWPQLQCESDGLPAHDDWDGMEMELKKRWGRVRGELIVLPVNGWYRLPLSR